jgi:hypothetical protein
MGILWRLLALKSLKKARWAGRQAGGTRVRTASWAASAHPVKQARRAAVRRGRTGAGKRRATDADLVDLRRPSVTTSCGRYG